MKNFYKKILPFLLAIMLLIAVFPFTGITAYASYSVSYEDELFEAVEEIVNSEEEEEDEEEIEVDIDEEYLTPTDEDEGDDVIRLEKSIAITKCLRIPAGRPVTIDLNGYTLDRGLKTCQDIGSVIRVEPNAELIIKDSSHDNSGLITGGASWNGGGICNHGTLTIEGGTIRGNKSLHNTYGGGGGIFNGSYQGSKATLTIEGGVIEKNQSRNGAGIYNSDGTLIIKQGSYSVTELSQLKTYKTNVKITNNTATANGSGIYSSSVLKIQDSPSISGNQNDDDIYLSYGKKITITGKLADIPKIGVKAEGSDAVITSGYSSYQTEDPGSLFKSVTSGAVVRMTSASKGEVMLRTSTKTLLEVFSVRGVALKAANLTKREEFNTPQEAWNRLSDVATDTNAVHITLGSDWSHDNELAINSKKYVIVDLNGHYIKRTRNAKMKDNGGVFIVKEGATLTVNDSNPNSRGYDGIKGGVITGGASENTGGGITVEKNASLYMNGGTIYECVTNYRGGGICALDEAKLIILRNCSIYFCQTWDSTDDCPGGGIYAKKPSRFALENATIKDCYSEDNGGGFYYYGGYNGIFIVSGCKFIGNKCKDDGAAAYYSASEGGYFDKSMFSTNKAGDDGACVYAIKNGEKTYSAKKDEPVMIRECKMQYNECVDEGSAVFADREDLVFLSCEITENYAGDKGAVYLSHKAGSYGYDISVKGMMIVKDNTAKDSNHKDIVLENYGATNNYIYNAGLYNGSYISFSANESGKVKAIKNIDRYQLRYYHPEKGSLTFEKEKDVDATLVTASLFGTGSIIAVCVIAGVAALALVSAMIYKKKKGDAVCDEDE